MTPAQIDVAATSKRLSEPADCLGEFVALLLEMDAMRKAQASEVKKAA